MEGINIVKIDEFENELSERIAGKIQEIHGKKVTIEPKITYKTNIAKQALVVHFEDTNISPTLYTEELFKQYADGISLDDIVTEMSDLIYNAYKDKPMLPELTVEEAKKHIILDLVNTKMNQELLKDAPSFTILNGELSAIPRWQISDEASFIVKNSLVSTLKLTPEEVLQMGQQNVNNQEFEIHSMSDILKGMLGEDVPNMEEPKMLVITNDRKLHGANALLSEDTLKQVYEQMGEQRYAIIPSSIHEVIAIPVEESMNPADIRSLICEVNSTTLDPEEVLSDQLMIYDGTKLSLVGNTIDMETPAVDKMKFDRPLMALGM